MTDELERKRKGGRPRLGTKSRPNLQQIYVPCAGIVYRANAESGKRGENVDGHNLNDEMADDDCCDATVECFRDVVYLSKGIRQSGVKRLNTKSSNHGPPRTPISTK